MAKYVTLENLAKFKELYDVQIAAEDAKALKTVLFDEANRTIKFYKIENPATDATADYTVKIPEDVDISGLMSKIANGTAGNLVVVADDGEVSDSGTALVDLALKTEVEAVSLKVGTITDLETTAKTDLVGAINEVKGAVDNSSLAAAVTIETSSTTEGMLKSYTVKQGETTIGTIDIPKDLVVVSGTVETNPEGQAEGTYIKLVIANQTDPLYINVGTLVDLYKAKANATQVQLTIDNSTREISATIVAGSITATELAENAVTTAKIADANVTLSKLATDVTEAFDSKGSAAQALTDAKAFTTETNTAMDTRVKAVEDALAEEVTDDDIAGLF